MTQLYEKQDWNFLECMEDVISHRAAQHVRFKNTCVLLLYTLQLIPDKPLHYSATEVYKTFDQQPTDVKRAWIELFNLKDPLGICAGKEKGRSPPSEAARRAVYGMLERECTITISFDGPPEENTSVIGDVPEDMTN